jgi:hypothetical protein
VSITSSFQTPCRDGTVAHDSGFCVQVKAAGNFAMAYHFAGAAAGCAKHGFCALAVFADAFAGATGAVDFSIDAVGARNGFAFIGGISIYGIGDWYPLVANAFEDVGHFLVD